MSSASPKRNRQRSRLLAGLDQDVIISTPSDQHSKELTGSRFDDTSHKQQTSHRSTRQYVGGQRKRPLYDQKAHPMDEVTDLRKWNAFRKREGLPPVRRKNNEKEERLYSGDTGDEEPLSPGPDLSDGGSSNDEDPPPLSDGLDSVDSEEQLAKRSKRKQTQGQLFGHAVDPLASRRSNRLQTQHIRRPLYNTKFHPDDKNIPFFRSAARKRLAEVSHELKETRRERKKQRYVQEDNLSHRNGDEASFPRASPVLSYRQNDVDATTIQSSISHLEQHDYSQSDVVQSDPLFDNDPEMAQHSDAEDLEPPEEPQNSDYELEDRPQPEDHNMHLDINKHPVVVDRGTAEDLGSGQLVGTDQDLSERSLDDDTSEVLRLFEELIEGHSAPENDKDIGEERNVAPKEVFLTTDADESSGLDKPPAPLFREELGAHDKENLPASSQQAPFKLVIQPVHVTGANSRTSSRVAARTATTRQTALKTYSKLRKASREYE